MRKTNWWMIVAVGLAVLVFVLAGVNLAPRDRGYGSESGQDSSRGGMMSENGDWWSWNPLFALLMPLFMILMPLLWLSLMVLGVVWLARAVFGPRGPFPGGPTAAPSCNGCGRPIQAGWQVCPHCGHALA